MQIIKADRFARSQNATLLKLLSAMSNQDGRIDIALLAERLKREGNFDAIGGSAYLAEVAQSVPYAANTPPITPGSSVNAPSNALDSIGIGATTRFMEPPAVDRRDTGGRRNRNGQDQDGREYGGSCQMVLRAAMSVLDQIEAIMTRQDQSGIYTGLEKFDNDVGGLFPGEYCVLAGTSSIWKDRACMPDCGLQRGARETGLHCLAEMESQELAAQVCTIAGVNSRAIRTASLSKEERQRLIDAADQFSRRTIRIKRGLT